MRTSAPPSKIDAHKRSLYLRLLRYVKPYRRAFALAIGGMVATAATEPVFPAIMKFLLDNGFRTDNDRLVWMIPLGIVALFVVRSIFVYTSGYLMMWISSRIVTDLRRAMFNKLLTLPTSYSDRQSAGQTISRLVYDVSHISEAATTALVTIIRELLTAIALLAYLLYLDWRLTLITLCVGPLIAFLVKSFSKRMRSASQQSMAAMQETSYVIEETASAQKVVKIYGGQTHQRQQFHEATERFRRAQMKEAIPATATTPITHVAASMAIALIAFLALSQTMGNAGASPGGFVSFITAMLLLIAPLKQLTSVKTNLQRGLAAAENVFAFLDMASEPDRGTRQLHRAHGKVEFDKVVFSYPESERQAISDLSIQIEPGQTVALVGSSGSGKSTLGLLLPRFYSPQSGRILIDDIDIESISLASLRTNIALVSQEVMLFNDTVRANIAYGSLENVSEEQIISAAKAANAWEFIKDLPDGLDTIIGDNGSRLSGGQKQRLAIARAILKDAPILILDEATSALDNESERKVQAALEVLMRGKTTLVIAHRLSTIEKADRIYVISQGKVAETGTHHELLKSQGVYFKFTRTIDQE